MNYLSQSHRWTCILQLLTLIIAIFIIVAFSINIFVVPELHNQLLDPSNDGTTLFFGFAKGTIFSKLYSLQRLTRVLFLLVTSLNVIYLATGNRLAQGFKVIGKTQYVNELLIFLIFPYLLYGSVAWICYLFINVPFPYFNLYLTTLIILGLEMFIYFYLSIRHTDKKYKKLSPIDLVPFLGLLAWIIITYLIFFVSPSNWFVIINLTIVYCMTKVILKFTTNHVGI